MQVTVEERVDLRDKQVVIADVATLLGVHHEANNLVYFIGYQVVFGEDIKAKLFKLTVKAIIHLPQLALEDALHRQGQRPIVIFIGAYGIVQIKAIGVTAFLNLQQVFIHFFHRTTRHLINQRIGYVFVLCDGSGHLDANALFHILKVWSIGVHQMGIPFAQQGFKRIHRIAFKKTSVVFRGLHDIVLKEQR